MDRNTQRLLIGLCALGALGTGVLMWWDSRHRFSVSCDERLRPDHPQSECTDYYRDYFEATCATSLKDTPCERAGALGGCRAKARITWHYRSSDAGEKWREQCESGEKPVGTDWKEPEE